MSPDERYRLRRYLLAPIHSAAILYLLMGLAILAIQRPLISLVQKLWGIPFERAEMLVPFVGVGLVLINASFLIFRYLNHGFSPAASGESSSSSRELYRLRDDVRSLLQEAQELAQAGKKEHSLSEEERAQMVANLSNVLGESLRNDAVSIFEQKYAAATILDRQNQRIREEFSHCEERLNSEINKLGRRGNINLTLGFLTTMVALGVLAQITFFSPLPQDLSNYGELAMRYLPRLALAVFIQVFAFFFLRLYRTTLEEIKFFQNEMTNIELAAIALETSNKAKDAPYLQDICKRLLEIDRNSGSRSTDRRTKGKNTATSEVTDLVSIAKDILAKVKT